MSEPFNPFAAPEAIEHVQSLPGGNIEGLAGVERGLKLVYIGICGVFLAAMTGGLLSVVFPPAVIVAGGVILICWLMLIIGPFLCLTAPDETGAKGLIGASILCQLGGFLLSLVPNIGILTAPAAAVLAAGPLLGVIGSVLFVLFLMKIAKYVGRDDLQKKGRNVLIGSSVLFVIAVGAMATLVSGGQGLGALGLVIVLIGGLIVFVMYANLINYLSKAIASLRAGNLTGQQTSNYVG